ncbi:sensor histidine kinase [Paenibacillus sinopodophylli]|uniref:sensor histidine kinase n=1 Tax=Paenibacillus sinopodophylli TaxID=1837342 RepID=UPI00110CA787|nr:histidine kinase [Paenibacillus sinopodophylli]
MRPSHRQWQFSIFKRLIIAFIIATIPIYMLAGILYSWATGMLRQDIVNSAETQSENYIRELNSTFKRFNSLQYDMMNDMYLVQLVNAYDILESYRKIELINFLRAKLVSIRNSSDLIFDVRLYLSPIDVEISAVDGYGALKENAVPTEKLVNPYNVISYKNKLLIVAFPLDSVLSGTPELVVEIELRATELKRSLKAAAEREFTGAMVLGLSSSSEKIIAVKKTELSPLMEQSYTSNEATEQLTESSFADKAEDYIYMRSVEPESGIYLDHFLYKPTMFRSVIPYIQWFWLFFTATIIMVGFYLLYINRAINKPLVKIVRAFKRVEEGNLDLNIRHDKDDEFGFLYERFNEMLIKLQISIDEVYNQQIHRQNAELKQLQSQINPHFLYNCLFSIIRLIKMQKEDEAVQFTNQLAKYFQFITRNTRDTVPLENEAAHARNYVMLQLTRFSDRVTIDFGEIPEKLKSISVPRLIIQPLVENAFVHGLENVTEGGLLRVSFTEESGKAIIVVEDNGEASEEGLVKLEALLSEVQEVAEVTGTLNVHRRLKYSYGPESGLQVERSELGGLKVKMIIEWDGEMAHVPDADRR